MRQGPDLLGDIKVGDELVVAWRVAVWLGKVERADDELLEVDGYEYFRSSGRMDQRVWYDGGLINLYWNGEIGQHLRRPTPKLLVLCAEHHDRAALVIDLLEFIEKVEDGLPIEKVRVVAAALKAVG